MGGLHGHIYHLYDNPSLSFGQMKNIFHLAVQGKLEETYEKLDGQNVVFSYDLSSGTIAFARNKGDIKTGGMGLADIQEKWKKLPKVQAAYLGAYKTLQGAISNMTTEQAANIFGPNKNIWYSAEIITSVNPNVINYGKDAIVLHKSGFVFDKSGSQIEGKDTTKNFEQLKSAVSNVSDEDKEHHSWEIWQPIVIALKKSKDVAQKHEGILSGIMSKYGMSDSDTIKDFIAAAFEKHVLSGYDLTLQQSALVANVFAKKQNKLEKKKELFANFEDRDLAKDLYSLIQNDINIKKLLLKPLENLVHHFAVDVLNNTRSLLVANHEKEVERLKNTLSKELETLKQPGGEDKLEKLKTSLEKLKSVDNITSSMEGITFQHDGHTYKLTGNFAPVNQILGMIRYG